MDPIHVLIVGSGGREHALAWACAQSLNVDRLYVAPGNAGTAAIATNVPIAADDIHALAEFARDNDIGLTLIGPEATLAAGLVDLLQRDGLRAFGPTQSAAQLESSKAFAKTFMADNGIPTGAFAAFNDLDEARAHLNGLPERGVVVKASGLAAGKGVIVCERKDQALDALERIMVDKEFGSAGTEVLIEERLSGPELSVLAFCDGKTVVPMVPARDHKRAYDGDEGPNTGGMGVYAPPADADTALIEDVVKTILQPTVDAMATLGTPYVGVLYAGLMLTEDGPKVLEFNCRFGDPETQVIMPLLQSDLVELCLACIDGKLADTTVQFRREACVAVVLAAGGYPGRYDTGQPITGVNAAAEPAHTEVYHAGTARRDDKLVTAGGRVLAVAARGADLAEAARRAYAGVEKIHFDGMHFRRDIGR